MDVTTSKVRLLCGANHSLETDEQAHVVRKLMKIMTIRRIVLILAILLCPCRAWPENVLNSDADFAIKIAVTINSNDHIVGKLEYSNHKPQYTLQLVTFAHVAGQVYSEPYFFELIEKTIIIPNVHRIKCTSINDKYGAGTIVLGTIDFRDELKPKVNLVNENGNSFVSNLTTKGKEVKEKYIPNVWLGY
jgi:hypothetical protein